VTACDLSPWQSAPGVAQRPIFAIGDVHGRLDLLTAMHEHIRDIIGGEELVQPLIVHLGDYIDRGPHPIACLKKVLDGVAGIETMTLAGNHEQFMYRCLTAAEAVMAGQATGGRRHFWQRSEENELVDVIASWFDYNCGTAVARELGFSDPLQAFDDPWDFHRRLTTAMGPEMLQRFRTMPNHFRLGDYFFIHGGLHPTLGLDEQLTPHWGRFRYEAPETDPLWIRGPFLTHPGQFEFESDDDYADYTGPFIVVHGHTVSAEPEARHNRIGVDTGAFMTGRLTAVELRGDQLRFLTATGPSVSWGEY